MARTARNARIASQSYGARYGIRRAATRAEIRRRFGAAAQARAKARLLSSSGGREEPHVLALRCACRTHGSAVHAGRLHGDEEASIEAPVASGDRAVAG